MGFFSKLKKAAKKGEKMYDKGVAAHGRYQDKRLKNLRRQSKIEREGADREI